MYTFYRARGSALATQIGRMAEELTNMNPWWRHSAWADRDPDLRRANQINLGYRSPCLDHLEPGGLYILRGPRRVGKTVTIKQTIERLIDVGLPPRAIVRVAADTLHADDLRTIVQNIALPSVPADQPRWWFIDEITAIPDDWAAQLKWMRDNDPGFAAATVVITGSNAASLTAATGVLAGRRGVEHADRTLLPVGFRTFVRLMGADLPGSERISLARLREPSSRAAYDDLLPWLHDLVVMWETYILSGGFPVSVAAARNGDPVPESFLDDIFNVVFRDAFAQSNLSQSLTTALHERLMASLATPANLTKIGQDLSLPFDTVARHVTYLCNAYLAWECPQKADGSWTGRPRSQSKVYAIDPLLARLAHLHNPARTDIDPTVLTEQQVGMALVRAGLDGGSAWGDDHRIFFQRTPARNEIDFVSEELAGTAIEAKYTETGRWKREAATVDASDYDGIMVTRNVLDVGLPGAWAVPAGVLAYLIDT